MKFVEDPRIKTAGKCFALAWIFFSVFLTAILLTSYLLGIKPYLWGLPLWVAVGNIVVPVVFVILLIFIVEKFIPDVPLTDEDQETEEV
jgi:uncharacterized membrane protein YhdT